MDGKNRKRLRSRSRPLSSVALDGFSQSSADERGSNVSLDWQRRKEESWESETLNGFPGSDQPPEIALNCLLIPVVFAFWWFWTRRKARNFGVMLRLIRPEPEQERNDDGEIGKSDSFSTWEEVASNNAKDRSLRFVRWIHEVNASTKRSSSRQTFPGSPLRSPVMSEDSLFPSILSVNTLQSVEERRWQCLEEMSGFGTEMCVARRANGLFDVSKAPNSKTSTGLDTPAASEPSTSGTMT